MVVGVSYIHLAGSVDGNTHRVVEVRRRRCSVVRCILLTPSRGARDSVNLIRTPGHLDFSDTVVPRVCDINVPTGADSNTLRTVEGRRGGRAQIALEGGVPRTSEALHEHNRVPLVEVEHMYEGRRVARWANSGARLARRRNRCRSGG